MASKQLLSVSLFCLLLVVVSVIEAQEEAVAAVVEKMPVGEAAIVRVKRGKKLAMAGGAAAGAYAGNKLHKAGKSHRVKRGKKLAMAGGALAGAFVGNKLHKAGKSH